MINAVSDGSGIGNRLKNLVSALRQAHYENDGVFSYLGMNEFISFNQYCNSYLIDVKKEIMTHKLELLAVDKLRRKLKKNIPILYHHPSDTIICKNEIDFQYHNIDDEMIEEWLKYWDLITINPTLQQKIDEIVNAYDLSNCVGVHVRSWSDAEWRREHFYSFEKFVIEMEKFPDRRFFLACDSSVEVEKFKNHFKDKIVSLDFSGERHSKLNDNAYYFAFLDMFLLSKCNNLIGSYLSTFTECAWWLGKCKAEVSIPKTDTLEKIYKTYYEQLTFEINPIKFTNVPTHKNDVGEPGEVAFDDEGNFYLCFKKNLWGKQQFNLEW